MCPHGPHTLVWYQASASAWLRLAISSYWALTSAMMPSRSRERLLSMDSTTDVSEIWACSSDNSYRDQTEHQDSGYDPPLFLHPTRDSPHTHQGKSKGEEAGVGVIHQAARGHRPAPAEWFHLPWLPEESISNIPHKSLMGLQQIK